MNQKLEEMVKLMWFKEDPDKEGHLFESDVEHFMTTLHGSDGIQRRNVKVAMKALKFNREGSTTFRVCCAWCKAFPCLLEPAFRVQGECFLPCGAVTAHFRRFHICSKFVTLMKLNYESVFLVLHFGSTYRCF